MMVGRGGQGREGNGICTYVHVCENGRSGFMI